MLSRTGNSTEKQCCLSVLSSSPEVVLYLAVVANWGDFKGRYWWKNTSFINLGSALDSTLVRFSFLLLRQFLLLLEFVFYASKRDLFESGENVNLSELVKEYF